ncbi:hypothetical protein [Legionella sp. PC1000]|uniref:hypothetical protein n=1 Tax=Legionella TaxID=445 RepID=UPI0015FCFE29
MIILHGIRCWYENRGELRQNGHRVSRHYYDIYQLMHSEIGNEVQKRSRASNRLRSSCTIIF